MRAQTDIRPALRWASSTTLTHPADVQALIDEDVAFGFFPNPEAHVAAAGRGQVAALRALRASLDEAEADRRENGGGEGLACLQDRIDRLASPPKKEACGWS